MASRYGLVVVREPRKDTLESLDRLVRTAGPGGAHVVPIEGRECTSAAGLFDALARALDLPDYFGRNWDALDECLADLLDLTDGGLGSAFCDRAGIEARTLVLAFLDSGRLLDGGTELLGMLLDTFDHAVESNRGRNAAGLRVILQLDVAESAQTEAEVLRIADEYHTA